MDHPTVTSPEKCSGCGVCELVCSFANGPDGTFRPSASHVHPVRREGQNRFRVEFAPECCDCGLCAAHCGYGVFAGAPRPEAAR